MKLFTVGPVTMYPETLEVASKQLPYFRTDEFSEIMLENEKRLKHLLGLKNGCVAFLTGSGTSAMEAVVASSFTKDDRVLIINGGSFGDRFTQLCRTYHIPYNEVILAFGETLTEEKLYAYEGNKYCALLVNIHETSTGQLYDIEMLAAYTKKYNLYLIVDAISSFLADPYDMDKHEIDCTILSSQKALALSPGISMIAMQSSFYKEMIEPKENQMLYLSIKEHIKNMERGQTPYTPAVGILLELHQRLAMIEKQGLVEVQKEIAQRAIYFRQKLSPLHIETPNFSLSNAITPILLNGNANKVYTYLKEKYAIYVTPTGGKYKDNLLRVGHIGNLKLTDYDELCECMKEIIK